MMTHCLIILRKEWMSFVGSDRSVFVVYAVLVAGWGMLLAFPGAGNDGLAVYDGFLPLWLALFSVIVTANFANTVFVTERVTGSLEVLLTSGVSRNGILYGKLLFVVAMTLFIGICCFGLSAIVRLLAAQTPGDGVSLAGSGIFIYASASFLNAACSAFLSVVLPNPRLLHLFNLLLISAIMGVQVAVNLFFPLPVISGALVMDIAAVFFCVLAQREFNGERIIKPVIL